MGSLLNQDLFIDIAYNSLKKNGEELCGDNVEIFESEDRMIAVLADGLGSGVKANILATLTSKIMITMLENGESIEEVIRTLIATLPVCQVRKIAYSTFSIVEIDSDLNCKIVEWDNPPFVFIREGELLKPQKEEVQICDKKIKVSELKLIESDIIYLFSDGVVHAGIGRILNLGWTQEKVETYLKKHSKSNNAYQLSANLTNACNELYDGKPGDDMTVISIKVKRPCNLLMFTGPPLNKNLDDVFVKMFVNQKGKKIICGGTVANITARVLDKEIRTTIEYIDKDVPPAGEIEGIDLVTEGVVTLNRVTELIKKWRKEPASIDFARKDAATRLLKMLMDDCTHVDIWLGKAVNEAHQYHGFPTDLNLKVNIVKALIEALQSVGKTVRIRYISEMDDSDFTYKCS